MLSKSDSEFEGVQIGAILLLSFILCLPGPAFSVVRFDGSTVARGSTATLSGPTYTIEAGMGTQRGTNLFHSFSLFNISTGEKALFTGTGATGPIGNIIGRITGGSPSSIDGGIASTIPNANLYLLNPYGFMFGPNAWINVPGSFHVSTADYLKMSDGAKFYADLGKTSILSTEPVTAFGFLSNNPAPISIQESNLMTPESKTLSVVGGEITIAGGPTGWLLAAGGRINIASVASPGEVIPVESRNAPDLQMSSFDHLGKINLLDRAYLDVSSSNGNGTVVIRGGKLLIENSHIVANNLGDIDGTKMGIDIGIKEGFAANGGLLQSVTTGNGQGGDVVIRSGSMEMNNVSKIMASTEGSGSAGNIEVNTGSLKMKEGSQIINNASFFSYGNAGDVTVIADSISMSGVSDPTGKTTGLYSVTDFGSTGRGGDLKVTVGNLAVLDGATIFSSTYGSGAGGNVEITAENIWLSGKNMKGLSATIATWSNFFGNAGSIRINTGNLEVQNGNISTSSGFLGKAGDLDVTADHIILKEGAGVFANGYIGDGGNIRIKAGSLEVTDGAQIMSNTQLSGAGGDIEVTANSILLSGVDRFQNRSAISSSVVSEFATGAGGDIRINAQSLEVKEGAIITAATIGPGDGGKIELNAESVQISGTKNGYTSSLLTDTASSGKAGDIKITTNNLEVKNGGTIEASTFGSGNGGSIDITANNVVISGVIEDNYALIWALSGQESTGKGGVIQISTNNLEIKDGGQINASTLGQGEGGGLTVKAKSILIDGGSYVDKGVGMFADTYGIGSAGDIDITTNSLKMRGLAQISTSTRAEGEGGSLRINAGKISLSGTEGDTSTGLYSVALSSGNGGDIQVTARNLEINNGALISSSTKSAGKAGNISLTAPWINMANGADIRASSSGSGAGGNIQLSGNQIQLFNRASISAESLGTGNAGDISINAGSTLLMNNSSVTTEAKQADGGNIQVHTGYMVNLIDSVISASVNGGPDTVGGNINIDPQYVILNDSKIIANAYQGKGGNIRIVSGVFFASPESVVSASSKLGIDGTVDIRSPIRDISGILSPVNVNFLQTAETVRDRCIARIKGSSQSSLTVSGRDGLPPRPGMFLPALAF